MILAVQGYEILLQVNGGSDGLVEGVEDELVVGRSIQIAVVFRHWWQSQYRIIEALDCAGGGDLCCLRRLGTGRCRHQREPVYFSDWGRFVDGATELAPEGIVAHGSAVILFS